MPNTVEFNSDSPCAALRVQSIAEDAKRAGIVMSFSAGTTAGAGAFFSYETGLAYGNHGEFGCLATACVGNQSDVSVANYASFGISNDYAETGGFSIVTGGAVDTPFLQLGFQTSQVWSAAAPQRAGDFLKNRLTGSSSGISYGVSLTPIAVSGALCYTARMDGNAPLDGLKDMKGILEGWGRLGFVADKTPAQLRKTPPPVVPADAGWTRCAIEGGTCSFPGTRRVRYGADGRFVTRVASNAVACSNDVFGDPVVGVAKHCAYASGEPATNLARGKRAVQSSTLGAPAALAVDGNTDGVFNDGSVTHTVNQPGAWWMVDCARQD